MLTVLRDTNSFPQTRGMRIQLHDEFRQDMDLRAYLNAVEAVSGHNIGANVEVEWLNKPVPAMIDRFSAIVPNLSNVEPPELYDSIGVINYGDQALSEIIIEAQDDPQISFGENTFPAIVFEDPGNYLFHAIISPVILLENGTLASELPITGMGNRGFNHIFEVNIEEGAESVFQSLACSVKPTGMGQLAMYTLLIDNPWSFLDFWPSALAVKGTFKTIGALCDFMRGNYITAAGNLATLRVDILEKTFNTGTVFLSIEEYERLKRLIKLNNMYYKISNFSDIVAETNNIVQSRSRNPLPIDLPKELSVEQYTEVFREIISGELSAYDDLANWQYIGVINDGDVKLDNILDDSQQYSQENVHVFLLPPEANILNITTNNNADIFRYYRASNQEVYNADYQFISEGINSQLSMNLMETGLQIDEGADGSINSIFTPDILKIQTENPVIRLMLNQNSYQAGDTLTLSVSLDNPGESQLVDGYFILQDSTGQIVSLPAFSPGITPLVSNYLLPGKLQLPMTQVASLTIPANFPWKGQLQAIAAITYPGTQNPVGGKFSSINFNVK